MQIAEEKPLAVTERTVKNGTLTDEGLIPHLPVTGFYAPVVVSAEVRYSLATMPTPKRVAGCLVYALPGGCELVHNPRKQ